jgi:transposase
MNTPRYRIELTAEERDRLEAMSKPWKAKAIVRKRAQALLLLDQGSNGPAWLEKDVATAVRCSSRTIIRLRQQWVEEGMEQALRPKLTPALPPKFDGRTEAHLVALACSSPPVSRARWTLRLLRDRLVELQVVPDISVMSVQRLLKRNQLQPHRSEYWILPPREEPEFVACMEDVLDVYARPLDPRFPVICMDEGGKQLVDHVRPQIPMTPGHPHREDPEYQRKGGATVFLATEPLTGKCHLSVTQDRTAGQWAHFIRRLDTHYGSAERIVLVMDNLNVHSKGSLYAAFPPEEALRLSRRLEIHHTPCHGSWLNIAEIELSALNRQCLNQRIGSFEEVTLRVKAWEDERNTKPAPVNWQFTNEKARTKLRRLYPQQM